MSRKNNAPHPQRGRSHYRERLARRGYTGGAQPHLEDPGVLRARQQRRAAASAPPAWEVTLRGEATP